MLLTNKTLKISNVVSQCLSFVLTHNIIITLRFPFSVKSLFFFFSGSPFTEKSYTVETSTIRPTFGEAWYETLQCQETVRRLL